MPTLTKKLSRSQRALAEAILAKDGSEANLDAIVTLAEKVASDVKVAAGIESLKAGVQISVPVQVAEPVVDDDAIAEAKVAHTAEVDRTVAANAAVIQGIAITIVGAAALASGAGGGTAAIVAFLPAAKKILRSILGSA